MRARVGMGGGQAALSVVGNSSFSALVQSRYQALLRITRAMEADIRKGRASTKVAEAGPSTGAAGAAPAGWSADEARGGAPGGGSVSVQALSTVACALMEALVRQEPRACHALFAQLTAVLAAVPAGALALPDAGTGTGIGAGVPGRHGGGGGVPAGAVSVPGADVGPLSLPLLSAFLVRVAASVDSVVPVGTRALAAEVRAPFAPRTLACTRALTRSHMHCGKPVHIARTHPPLPIARPPRTRNGPAVLGLHCGVACVCVWRAADWVVCAHGRRPCCWPWPGAAWWTSCAARTCSCSPCRRLPGCGSAALLPPPTKW